MTNFKVVDVVNEKDFAVRDTGPMGVATTGAMSRLAVSFCKRLLGSVPAAGAGWILAFAVATKASSRESTMFGQ